MKWVSVIVFLGCVGLVNAKQFTPTKEPIAPDGTKAVCDIPSNLHMRNTGGMGPGGPGTGFGLCVWTSIEVNGIYQNIPELNGLQRWMTVREGGGSPRKVAALLPVFCKEKGVALPNFLQFTGGESDTLDLAMKTGRAVCVTYAGVDDFYSGTISHMVLLAFINDKWAAILDSNRPGLTIWMSREDFLKRWRANGGGWAIIFLNSPPPPYLPLQEFLAIRTAPIPFTDYRLRWEEPISKEEALNNLGVGGWTTVIPTQCPGGRCPTPPAPQLQFGNPPTIEHYWGFFPELNQWGWRLKDKTEQKPQPKVERVKPKEPEVENYGLDTSDISPERCYSLPDGTKILKGTAHAMIAGDALVDDSNRFFLTVVGDDVLWAKAKAAIAKLSPDQRSRLHIQYYSAGHWAVSQFKLPNGISLRKPAVNRIGAEVGSISADELTLDKLLELLQWLDGPPKPKLPKTPDPVPAPQPTPKVDPAPNTPPNNDPVPIPNPTNPNWLALLLLIGIPVLLLRRKS